MAQLVKNPPALQETWAPSPGWEDPLKKGKVTHSSTVAWRILWPGSQSDTTERLTFTFAKGKQEADCKFLNWNPSISSQEMQRGGWLIVNIQLGAQSISYLRPIYMLPQETHFKSKYTPRLKMREWKNAFQANEKKKTISNKRQRGNYIMIKGSIQQEDITILDVYTPSIEASKYIQQILTDIREILTITQ